MIEIEIDNRSGVAVDEAGAGEVARQVLEIYERVMPSSS